MTRVVYDKKTEVQRVHMTPWYSQKETETELPLKKPQRKPPPLSGKTAHASSLYMQRPPHLGARLSANEHRRRAEFYLGVQRGSHWKDQRVTIAVLHAKGFVW